MKCPTCNNPLKNVRYQHQAIDLCPDCGGIWFDKGELQAVVQSLISEEKVDYQTAQEAYNPKALPCIREEHRIRMCPSCHDQMDTFNYCYDSNIFLDKCSSCGGIWADKGEMKQAARYIKGNPSVKALAQSYAKAQDESIKYKLKLKELKEDLTGRISIGKLILMRLSIFPIPLKDDNPISRVPYVTLGLIALNVIIFIFQSLFIKDLELYARLVGLVPEGAFAVHRLYAFFSSMFVHAGILHIFGNLFFLWLFGDNIEDEWGSMQFLLFYLLCGIVGDITYIFLHPSLTLPIVGASGAISGIMGAYIVLYPRISVQTFWFGRIRQISAFAYLFSWAMIQFFYGIIDIVSTCQISVGFWAHIGGFLCGASYAFIVKERRRLLSK